MMRRKQPQTIPPRLLPIVRAAITYRHNLSIGHLLTGGLTVTVTPRDRDDWVFVMWDADRKVISVHHHHRGKRACNIKLSDVVPLLERDLDGRSSSDGSR